jgi:hypothetical protein
MVNFGSMECNTHTYKYMYVLLWSEDTSVLKHIMSVFKGKASHCISWSLGYLMILSQLQGYMVSNEIQI